ncbi:hypothetical protein Tco_0134123 [Tanacetum coccineum]
MHTPGEGLLAVACYAEAPWLNFNLPKNNAHAYMLFELGKSRKVKSTKNRNPKAARGQNQGNRKNKGGGKNRLSSQAQTFGRGNCPQYLAKLLKKKKNAASGAGGGSGSKGQVRNEGRGLLACTVGNGQREAVDAMATLIYLSLSDKLLF